MDAKVVLRSGYRVHALDARNFLNSMAQMLKHLLMLACTSMIAIGQVVAADASSAGGTAEKPALFMNLYSDEAKLRSELFESVARRHGFEVVRGRFGGEFNNDQLAVKLQGGRTLLLLGLKRTGPDGDLQLDQMSMGPFTQFSGDWLSAVVQVLKIDRSQNHAGVLIEIARKLKTLDLVVLLVDRKSSEVKFLGVETPE